MNLSAHQPPQIARANGIDICYEIFGDAAAEPMLLIMGLGSQMILWDDDFCRQLAARGFRVLRLWNNDILINTSGVLERILEAIETSPSPGSALRAEPPSPTRGEG